MTIVENDLLIYFHDWLESSAYPEEKAAFAAIFESEDFQRIATAIRSTRDALSTWHSLLRLAVALRSSADRVTEGVATPAALREIEEQNNQFESDLNAAVRFLEYWVDAGPGTDLKNSDSVPDRVVCKLIAEIKFIFEYTGESPSGNRLLGQKYNHRAYVIRIVADPELVPETLPNRAAVIARLMHFAGYPNTDRRLVTSILKEGMRRR